MVKKGDTLIEVTIAIGIFSMIAIAIASVMSSGTSGSQTALETTLAREEIDAQAEALRFIHSSYISNRNYRSKSLTDSSKDVYQVLWEDKITKNAITNTDDITEELTEYTPGSCDELYNDLEDGSHQSLIQKQHAFVLNIKKLYDENAYVYSNNEETKNLFTATSTYPRLVFTDNSNNLNNSDSNPSLIDAKVRSNLYQAAGIYIVAVKDPGTTSIATTATSAFYDFYVRTCWYGTDATRPSTISTVIRLYDPSVSSGS